MTGIEPPVCVALDVPDLDEARVVLRELEGLVPLFKIGLELFCAEGPKTVKVVHQAGAKVFLDLKVNDIPRTAAAAVREAAKLGVAYISIHGFGGRDMIRASVEAAREHGGPQVLVVSALTSFDDGRLEEVGVMRGVRAQAVGIGELAAEEGAEGLILSPRELDIVRNTLPHLFLATPGVRPGAWGADDHLRVLTPAEAVIAGADLVIVGRPIIEAADRAEAARDLIEEVSQAEAQRETRRGGHVAESSISEALEADMEDDTGS